MTTIYTEERKDGTALFRLSAMGVSLLYVKDGFAEPLQGILQKPSFFVLLRVYIVRIKYSDVVERAYLRTFILGKY